MSSSVKVISRSKGLFYIVEQKDTIKIIAKATHTLAPGIPISQSSHFVKEKILSSNLELIILEA